MRKFVTFAAVALGVACTAAGEAPPVREVRQREVVVSGALPADLVTPEGKTRWHLEGLPLGPASTVSVVAEEGALVVGMGPHRRVYTGPDGERWILPDRDLAQLRMGSRSVLTLDESRDGLRDELE